VTFLEDLRDEAIPDQPGYRNEGGLAQPPDDVRALTPVLQKPGFGVVALEDAGERDPPRGGRDNRGADGREDFIVPVDAKIWNEENVLRQGISIDGVLADLRLAGAGAQHAAVDASWRNPFEHRFRAFSHGLAPVVAPVNSLVLVFEPFDWTTDDREALRGLGRQMVACLGAAPGSAEEAFRKIRIRPRSIVRRLSHADNHVVTDRRGHSPDDPVESCSTGPMTAPRDRTDPVDLEHLEDQLPYYPLAGMRHGTYSRSPQIIDLLSRKFAEIYLPIRLWLMVVR